MSDRLPSIRAALMSLAALFIGSAVGWLVISGHRKLLELFGALVGAVAVLSIPSAVMTQAFAFVSQAFPKAGKLEHGIPIDVGVVLSVLLLARWGITLLVNPSAAPRRAVGPFRTVLVLWLVWLLLELLVGEVHHASLSSIVVEGSALGAAPLMGYWMAMLPDRLASRILGISRVALLFVVCFVFLQALMHGHHTAISGITVEAGGATGYAAIYSRNNATNVGLKMVATYQNGNLLGAYLALASPLVMLIGSVRLRVLAFAACLFATVLTLSRGAWFSVMAAFFVLAVISRKDRWPAYAIVCVVPVATLSTLVIHRLGHSFANLSGRTSQYHLLWSAMTQQLTAGGFLSWITGWGLGGGPTTPGGGQLISLDSSMLWMYISTGLVGLLLYGAMIWAVGRLAMTTRPGRILFAGMLGTIVFELIDGQLFYVPTAWNFWMFGGLAIAMAASFRGEPAAQAHAPSLTRER